MPITADRKRKRSAVAQRLHECAEELASVSSALTQCAFRSNSEPPCAAIRVVDKAPQPPPPRARGTPVPVPVPMRPPQSLLSFGAASAAGATQAVIDKAQDLEGDKWIKALPAVAQELAATDRSAMERSSRLLRRFQSLAASVRLCEAKMHDRTDTARVAARVEQQLEQDERAWEAQMQQQEQRVAELEVELSTLRETNRALAEDTAEDGEEEDATSTAMLNGSVSDDQTFDLEAVQEENRALREMLALRMEEKRDIEAAVRSLQRKKRRQSLTSAAKVADVASSQASAAPANNERLQQLQNEQDALMKEKTALQDAIVAAEQAQSETTTDAAARANAAETSRLVQEMTGQLQREREMLERVKAKMQHMVELHMTTTPTAQLREEAAILQLLYANNGEMAIPDLKSETATLLANKGKQVATNAVIRALYALVANGVVQIDRSFGSGLATLLLL